MTTICKWTYMSNLKAGLGGLAVSILSSSCWRILALLLSVRITELSMLAIWLVCGLLRSLSLYIPREWNARRLLIGTPRWIIAANCWRSDCSSRSVSTRTLISFLRPVRILKEEKGRKIKAKKELGVKDERYQMRWDEMRWDWLMRVNRLQYIYVLLVHVHDLTL